MTNCCGWKEKASDAGLLVLRLGMGIPMAIHGYQKIFGGIFPQLVEGLKTMGFPAPTLMAWLAALAEFVGGLCVALGLGTRVAAFFVFFTMLIATFVAHANQPFQVRELPFLFGITALTLMLTGGGRASLDALLCCRRKQCCQPAAEK